MHLYIFDYCGCNIYHTECNLPENNAAIEDYIKSNFNLQPDEISYMISYEPLVIQELCQ